MSEHLIREVNKINKDFNFERLKVYIHIPCICSKCKTSDAPNTYDFDEVKADLQKEDTKFHKRECGISRQTVDYRELLKTISHEALKEADEAQKLNKVGRYGDKGIMERMEERQEGFENRFQKIEEKIEKQHDKTRIKVVEEHDKTREILAEIPAIFRSNLKQTEENILAELLENTKELEAENEDIKDLIQMVGRGIDELFYKHPTKEDLLKAFQQVRVNEADESADFKHKLKASLWLIPTILKYEGEFATDDIIGYFKERWKAGGFKGLFLK